MPGGPKKPRIALLFAQFSAYHIDRCQAVAQRLAGRAEVVAVEVATCSTTYAWEASGDVAHARKVTLFPGANYDALGWLRRLWRQLGALWRCDKVLIGIGYNEPDIIVLSWILTLLGVEVIVLSESKFDDKPRAILFELFKALVLLPYRAAIVGGHRHMAYFRFLGFRKRPVLPGYDTVGLERVRAMGGGVLAPEGADFAEREFLFVGRFVAKKNLFQLIKGFELYARAAGDAARRLVLIRSGEEEDALRAYARDRGVSDRVDFPGFLTAQQVAGRLARGLALVLVSDEEQWGLVVNEAQAFGLPAIISTNVGSGDLLVRNLVNGLLVENGSVEGIASAMQTLGSNEGLWRAMVKQSHDRAWLGDTQRLADAVEWLCFAQAEAFDRIGMTNQFLACPWARGSANPD